MGKLKDLTGQRFGKLVALELLPDKGTGNGVVWLCKCDCGGYKKARSGRLMSGAVGSCGCATRRIDVTGETFGRLTVLERAPGGKVKWICQCACGNKAIVDSYKLRNGETKSCGCLSREAASARLKARPIGIYKSHKPDEWKYLRHIWGGMKARCTNKSFPRYADYGGRGISVCAEWMNSFDAFYSWAIDSGFRFGLQIDRIDVDGNYEPLNCRWATPKEQQRNRRNNRHLVAGGERKTMAEWSEITGVKIGTIWQRQKNGWPDEECIKPVKRYDT